MKVVQKNTNMVWQDKDYEYVTGAGETSSSDLRLLFIKHDLSWRGLAMSRLLSVRNLPAVFVTDREMHRIMFFSFLTI